MEAALSLARSYFKKKKIWISFHSVEASSLLTSFSKMMEKRIDLVSCESDVYLSSSLDPRRTELPAKEASGWETFGWDEASPDGPIPAES